MLVGLFICLFAWLGFCLVGWFLAWFGFVLVLPGLPVLRTSVLLTFVSLSSLQVHFCHRTASASLWLYSPVSIALLYSVLKGDIELQQACTGQRATFRIGFLLPPGRLQGAKPGD